MKSTPQCKEKFFNETGKELKFFKFPLVRDRHGVQLNEKEKERKRLWIKAVNRKDVTETKLQSAHEWTKVCSAHFQSG